MKIITKLTRELYRTTGIEEWTAKELNKLHNINRKLTDKELQEYNNLKEKRMINQAQNILLGQLLTWAREQVHLDNKKKLDKPR